MRRLANHSKQPAPHKRKGILTLEVILVLPILMMILMGIFEFSFLFTARGQVVDSSRAGARLATLHGVTEQTVEDEVRRSLSHVLAQTAQIETQMGEHPGDEVLVTVRVPMVAATPDLLWPVGYSVRDRYIIAQTRMVKE